MADPEATAAALLAGAGLDAPEFNPAETAGLLAEWREAESELDRLLAEAEPASGDPANFHAGWQ